MMLRVGPGNSYLKDDFPALLLIGAGTVTMAAPLASPPPLRHMPEDWQRALTVAHPDDLEYGCSAAVAAWTEAGRDVVYVLRPRHSRPRPASTHRLR